MASVLVVDDHEDTCQALARLIGRAGHEAVCQTSGAKALVYLSKQVPDLVLLDVMMPSMDGLDVLKYLRADPRTVDLPVIMFSACEDGGIRQRAMTAGATDYWLKSDIDFHRLAARLAPYLSPGEGDKNRPTHGA